MQNKTFITKKTLNLHRRLVNLSTPKVMGILNITPDSFYSDSRVQSEKEILTKAEKMLMAGASFLDVGGYSSRPGARDVSETEEIQRVSHAVKAILNEFPLAWISVDTFRSSVAKAAIHEGACMINDISGGGLDPEMFKVVAASKVPYIVMHMQGTPQTMSSLTNYNNLVKDIIDYFHKKTDLLKNLGINDIILDPGFGFAKTVEQNFSLLNHLDHFKLFDAPLLVGLSRKSMIWKTVEGNAEDALNGTTALNTIALLKGANILRVHDVKEAIEAIKLFSKTTLTNSPSQ